MVTEPDWDTVELQPLHHVEDPAIVVLRPVLGLTAYLDDPVHWARGAAREALRFFLDRVDAEALTFYTTSLLDRWRTVRGDGGADRIADPLDARLLLFDRPRHLLRLRLADFPNAAGIGFDYTEVDPARADRAAVLELTVPPTGDPGELLQLALELARLGPIHCMVGGYSVRWHVGEARLAHDCFYLWARRFLGLDARNPEMAWVAPDALPGTSWLTFVGQGLAARHDLDLDALAATPFREDVAAIPTPHGLLLRAGGEPTMGDQNDLDFPEAYAEVARTLAPILAEDLFPFEGPFRVEDAMRRWTRRFLDPKAWTSP